MTNQEQYELICEKAKKYDRLVGVFDKIKAEMIFYSNSFVLGKRNDIASAVSYCIKIIDKYRQEG